MAAKAKAKKQNATPNDLMKALQGGGYKLTQRFQRRGNTLVVPVKSAQLKGKDGNFRALEICAELGLQARCKIFAAIPEDLLIVSVLLPEAPKPETAEEGAD